MKINKFLRRIAFLDFQGLHMICRKILEFTQEHILISDEIEERIKNRIIPIKYPDFILQDFNISSSKLRERLIEHMGYVLLSKIWIEALSRWIGSRRCLEVMAGTGALTCELRKCGVDIVATDNYSWKKCNTWVHVDEIDAVEAVEKYKNVDILIMSWPPYQNDIAFEVLNKMRMVNPDCRMVYIGEEEGGCTANDKFFSLIEEIEDESFHKVKLEFQNWSGIHDRPFLIR
ncbi:MAG: hypothetical protein GX962_09355 [Epulopiscium sp.]|nr:hypothetical protein [Candidatus Epulonipiscium sp.]